jgi:hypothetical protein
VRRKGKKVKGENEVEVNIGSIYCRPFKESPPRSEPGNKSWFFVEAYILSKLVLIQKGYLAEII